MPILRSLLGEKRAIDASQFAFAALEERKAASGVNVDHDSAMTYSAVYACIKLNSEVLAAMPWDLFRIQGEDRVAVSRPPTWLTKPNPENSPFDFKQLVQQSLEADGNAYIYITALDSLAFPSELWVLDYNDVEPKRDSQGRKYFLWRGTESLAPWDQDRPATGTILHIKAFAKAGALKGLSPIDLAREAIGLGLVTERFGAGFFGDGQNPSGVIELGPGVKADDAFKKAIKETWVRSQGGIKKAHSPAVLAGATWKPITISPENAQFLQTRKHQVGDVARWFGTPPWLIGDVEKSTSWGTGIEQQFIGWKQVGLQPRATRLEQAFASLTPRGQVLRINLMGLLRGDQKARFEAYAIGLQNKIYVPNEVRHLEDMNSVPWGDEPIETQNPTGSVD